jgi:ketosteroid isomerase-like protein
MDINQWLEAFNTNWSAHNIDAVMDLFTDDVEYWETPHYKLDSKDHLRQEWQAVLTQQDIQLHTEVFNSSQDNRHAVIWQLSYARDGELRESAGTYLIGLDDNGLCNFFHYVSAPKTQP